MKGERDRADVGRCRKPDDEDPGNRASRKSPIHAPSPEARAIALLARREHARMELIRKLVEREIDRETASSTVDDLASRGFQSDARYIDMLVRTRIAGGCGPMRIAADLATAGIDPATGASTAATELEQQGIDWIDVARAALGKRGLGGRLDVARQRRAYAFLQRRGFGADTIREALRRGADEMAGSIGDDHAETRPRQSSRRNSRW